MDELLDYLKTKLIDSLSAVTSYQLEQTADQNEQTLSEARPDQSEAPGLVSKPVRERKHHDVNIDVHVDDHDVVQASTKSKPFTLGKKTRTKQSVNISLDKKRPKRYRCKHCPKVYKSRQARHAHMRRKHNGTIDPKTREMVVYVDTVSDTCSTDTSSSSPYDGIFG